MPVQAPGPIHPSVLEKLEHFGSSHLADPLKGIVERFGDLADWLASEIESHPQLAIGLQKLIEAKDAVVRAKVAELKVAGRTTELKEGSDNDG